MTIEEEDPMRVLVTGAASGIGRATCLKIAADAQAANAPACIAAVDLTLEQPMHQLQQVLQDMGAQVRLVAADMGSVDGPAEAVSAALDAFDGLDGLVSNAGINRIGPLLSYTVEDWDAVFAVNTRATWLLAQAAHDALARSGGAIVVTSSMSGQFAHAGLGAYGPSKAAVSMLTKVLAQEFGRDGIRCNTVCPGMVQTGMTRAVYEDAEVARQRDALVPLGRVAQPEDLARVIAFLLGPEAGYINGQDITVDGGVTGNLLGRLPGLGQITRA
jgi:glucose 1-dehydrogenase